MKKESYQMPGTTEMDNAWRRMCVIRAIECRKLGNEWSDAKRDALKSARQAKWLSRNRQEMNHVA